MLVFGGWEGGGWREVGEGLGKGWGRVGERHGKGHGAGLGKGWISILQKQRSKKPINVPEIFDTRA